MVKACFPALSLMDKRSQVFLNDFVTWCELRLSSFVFKKYLINCAPRKALDTTDQRRNDTDIFRFGRRAKEPKHSLSILMVIYKSYGQIVGITLKKGPIYRSRIYTQPSNHSNIATRGFNLKSLLSTCSRHKLKKMSRSCFLASLSCFF